MATTSATDIVSVERLLRELRAPETLDNTLMLPNIIESSVRYVSQYTYPLLDATSWHRVIAPSCLMSKWRINLSGLVGIERAGYWLCGEKDSIEPPHLLSAAPEYFKHRNGRVDLYPPDGGWPSGASYLGIEANVGWREDSDDGPIIAQAVVLWSREIYEDAPSIALNHPVWTLIRTIRPAVPISEVLLNYA